MKLKNFISAIRPSLGKVDTATFAQFLSDVVEYNAGKANEVRSSIRFLTVGRLTITWETDEVVEPTRAKEPFDLAIFLAKNPANAR